jgi:hypothetical protein
MRTMVSGLGILLLLSNLLMARGYSAQRGFASVK